MKVKERILFGLIIPCFLIAGLSWAQGTDIKGSKDHPLISRYQGSYILDYDFKEYDAFVLPLGKQIREPKTDRIVPVKSQKLEGKATRILYVAPLGRSSLEVFRNYQKALAGAGFETLFSCEENQCGSLFGYAHYPLERQLKNTQVSQYAASFPKNERYLAAKLSRPQGEVFVSLYVWICGFDHFKATFNHSVTLLEIIETKPMEAGLVTVNAEKMAQDLQRTGHVPIYGIYFDFNKAEIKTGSEAVLKEMARLLQTNPQLKVHIVGHTDNVGTLSYNLDLSQRRAEAVVNVLVKQYHIAAGRLVAKGVGPLAPVASNRTEEGRAQNRRVELVEQ